LVSLLLDEGGKEAWYDRFDLLLPFFLSFLPISRAAEGEEMKAQGEDESERGRGLLPFSPLALYYTRCGPG